MQYKTNFSYMRNASATQLSEAWSSLLTLVREGCSLSAPAQFLLAALLHELMIKCCPLEEKKDQRDLQDVTAKVRKTTQSCKLKNETKSLAYRMRVASVRLLLGANDVVAEELRRERGGGKRGRSREHDQRKRERRLRRNRKQRAGSTRTLGDPGAHSGHMLRVVREGQSVHDPHVAHV